MQNRVDTGSLTIKVDLVNDEMKNAEKVVVFEEQKKSQEESADKDDAHD